LTHRPSLAEGKEASSKIAQAEDEQVFICKKYFQLYVLPLLYVFVKNLDFRGIPRWWLEGRSRKRASYSEILERHWRHTLQA
jgi:hypothetical protein